MKSAVEGFLKVWTPYNGPTADMAFCITRVSSLEQSLSVEVDSSQVSKEQWYLVSGCDLSMRLFDVCILETEERGMNTVDLLHH